MAKMSPQYIKYIIHASVYIDGVVEKPDVIGAIFGQTEGLLGPEMDLRELQRSAKIGRIEVDLRVENGKTIGEIRIPTSTNRFETSLIAATLETVTKIGPTHATIRVQKIEDVRKTKIQSILERARELLNKLINEEMPDPKELLMYLEYSQNMKSLIEYGPEKLPAGPDVGRSEEIILVEGRADVLNLLRYGITNVIALNGLNVPKTIVELSKRTIVTTFFDGDRGGDLLVKECMLNGVEIDYVAKPDPGKEVEELSRKEIMKALKNRVAFDQVRSYYERLEGSLEDIKVIRESKKIKDNTLSRLKVYMEEAFKKDLAILLDENFNIINKVPVEKLEEFVFKNPNITYIVMDGILSREFLEKIEKSTNIKYILCLDAVQKTSDKIKIYTLGDLDRV
ncbi:MAG: DNA primase DnaG [Nanopusillaceae archaeon]